MRITQSRALAVTLIAALALPIAGCASGRAAKGDLPYVARDVGTLYSTAKARLDQGRYKEAAQLFDEVERQHPYSIWARRAQIMSAFSYYLARDYTASISSAQRFLAVHPGNRDAPYAYYLIALGYYEQITDVTRDQKITRQALDSLGELMRRYPNTRYASDARLKIDLVNDHLAGKEMEIGRFYETRGQWLAANGRFRTVIDKFQQTTHTPEALMRLTETYLALGVPVEAEKAGAVLGRNYPGTDWYQHAYDLLKKNQVPAVPPLPAGEQVVPVGTKGTPSVMVELDEPGSTPTGPSIRTPEKPRSAGQPSNTGS
ncbi:outer membrane protein assembly factor BamD [Sphingomonas sp. CFBP 13728]|uniref:outer membrane protein assembly factor BamD n=1 Tax=Sphingomonas sp. CFBP 13728 TaxID=2775294 RepID=UPI00177F966D|nr:outer membrane protein assembly factor BamD [Sphingomonas sp. CFBP 13728]MBD8618871.1 outer membrane protein assembly factor BamD [Sphingomonas sp. CFBP 13728]